MNALSTFSEENQELTWTGSSSRCTENTVYLRNFQMVSHAWRPFSKDFQVIDLGDFLFVNISNVKV